MDLNEFLKPSHGFGFHGKNVVVTANSIEYAEGINAKRLFDYIKYMVEEVKAYNYMSLPIQMQELYSSVATYFRQVTRLEADLYHQDFDYSDATSDFIVLHPLTSVRQIIYGSKDAIEKEKDPIFFVLGVAEGGENCYELTILTEEELFYLLCVLFKYTKEVLPADCAANAESLTFGYEHIDDYSDILLEASLQSPSENVTELNAHASNVKFTLKNPNVQALSIVSSSYGILKNIFADLFNIVPYEDGGILLLLRQSYLNTNKKTIAAMIVKNITGYFNCSFENGYDAVAWFANYLSRVPGFVCKVEIKNGKRYLAMREV